MYADAKHVDKGAGQERQGRLETGLDIKWGTDGEGPQSPQRAIERLVAIECRIGVSCLPAASLHRGHVRIPRAGDGPVGITPATGRPKPVPVSQTGVVVYRSPNDSVVVLFPFFTPLLHTYNKTRAPLFSIVLVAHCCAQVSLVEGPFQRTPQPPPLRSRCSSPHTKHRPLRP